MIALGIVVGLAAYIVYIAARCPFRIDEGHIGVLTSFGAAVREEGKERPLRLYRSGLHFKWPWQDVHRISLMEQIIELSGDERGRTVMMADGTVLHIDSILRFCPVESEVARFLFDLKEPKKHIAELFACLLRHELSSVRPQTNSPEASTSSENAGPGGSLAIVRRERRRVNAEIMKFCQKEIGDVYGAQFSAVDLIDIRPPDELDEALNGVASAQSGVEELISRTEADCGRRLIAANRGVEVAKANAKAAEKEIAGHVAALLELEAQGTLDLYVERRRIEVLSQSRLHYVRTGKSEVRPQSGEVHPRKISSSNAIAMGKAL